MIRWADVRDNSRSHDESLICFGRLRNARLNQTTSVIGSSAVAPTIGDGDPKSLTAKPPEAGLTDRQQPQRAFGRLRADYELSGLECTNLVDCLKPAGY